MTDSSTSQDFVVASGKETLAVDSTEGGGKVDSRRVSITSSSAIAVEIEGSGSPVPAGDSTSSSPGTVKRSESGVYVHSSILSKESPLNGDSIEVKNPSSNSGGDISAANYVAAVSEVATAGENLSTASSSRDIGTGSGGETAALNHSQAGAVSASTSTSSGRQGDMSGNSEFHSSRPSGSSSSSSRRQRNGLFGINIDLNFDPSWLVPSNVAGRSISSLAVLPDWVRRPVDIIPNRAGDNNSSNLVLSEGGRQGSHNHNYHPSQGNSTGGSGAASRMVTHNNQQPASGSSWSSSFASSSSIPNMHHHNNHGVPLRTRHTVTSMRSVDEDLDADYNPVSTIDLGAGRDRGDSQSYVIDMDSPMGGWAEDDGESQIRGAVGGSNIDANNVTSASVGTGLGGGTGDNSNGNGGSGARRSNSDLTLPQGAAAGGGGGEGGGSPSMADAATAANERTRAAEILRDAPETRAFINEISRYTTIRPFIVINFLKGVFDHGTSILAFLALVVTFSHANSMVKKEVSKQRKRNLLYLSMIIINLAACVAFIYYIFNEMELYYALVFLPTGSDLTSFWSLMWAVGVTDYVAKFGTVFAKIFVLSLPGCVLPFQKRGKYYLFVEITSQLYRSFLPVYPWMFYLVSCYEGTSRLFGLFLAGLYVCFKISDSIGRFKEWLKALEKLLSNVHYGTIPTAKQLDSAGTICPICHDNFSSPTRLQCNHIFCEECVATWFDRERTCPMCRAKVVDDPTYRDGATAQYVQLF